MFNIKIENHSSDLVNRILQKSYDIVQKKPLFHLLKGVFKDLSLPAPQYALSLVFVVGIALSLFTPEAVSYELIDDVYVQGVLDYE